MSSLLLHLTVNRHVLTWICPKFFKKNEWNCSSCDILGGLNRRNRSETASKRFSTIRKWGLKKSDRFFLIFPSKNMFSKKVRKKSGKFPNISHKGVLQISNKIFGIFPIFFELFLIKYFFDLKKSKNLDPMFLNIISWSRRIVLKRCRNDSGRLNHPQCRPKTNHTRFF